MTSWTFGDLVKIIICLTLGYFLLSAELREDKRPENVKYVEDPRNGCELRSELLLANHLIHIKHAEYQPKVLRIYDCANNQVAANIDKE